MPKKNSAARNSRRLGKKAFEKYKETTVKSMNMLQKYVLTGLERGTITKDQIKEMCAHFLENEVMKEIENFGYEVMIKQLEESGYIVTKKEEETDGD